MRILAFLLLLLPLSAAGQDFEPALTFHPNLEAEADYMAEYAPWLDENSGLIGHLIRQNFRAQNERERLLNLVEELIKMNPLHAEWLFQKYGAEFRSAEGWIIGPKD